MSLHVTTLFSLGLLMLLLLQDVGCRYLVQSEENEAGNEVTIQQFEPGFVHKPRVDESYRVPVDTVTLIVSTTTEEPEKHVVNAPLRPKCPPGTRYHKASGICRKVYGSSRT
ncbi:hypothetical protein C0J52_03267 [Blattella germanica]|nr:hypothetical protein C0J52_03267 [Blattella germanica]